MDKKKSCDVNFSKVSNRTVKVFVGDTRHNGVEIIGQKGQYCISANGNKTLHGKTGTLSEMKKAVSNHLCSAQLSSVKGSKVGTQKGVSKTRA